VRVEEGSHQFVSNWIKKITDYGMKDSIPIRELDMKSTGSNMREGPYLLLMKSPYSLIE
jgi:hypothetical protein